MSNEKLGGPPVEPQIEITNEECERIARRVCRLLGLDPDAHVQVAANVENRGFAHVNQRMTTLPRYRVLAPDVRVHLAWFSAIGDWVSENEVRLTARARRAVKDERGPVNGDDED